MPATVHVLLAAGLCFLLGCGEEQGVSDTPVSVRSFGCVASSDLSNLAFFVLTAEELAVLGGLECVAWSYDDSAQTLDLDVINHEDECRDDWRSSAAVTDGALRIAVRTSSTEGNCDWTGCSCNDQWSLRVTGVDAAVVSSLVLWRDICGSTDDPVLFERSVDLASEPSGLSCHYRHPGGAGPTECGAPFSDCPGTGAFCAEEGEATNCTTGTTCAQIDEDWSQCLPACSDDTPCPMPAILSCEGATCQLR